MAQFILKDSKGKEQTFDHETIYVRDTNGELVQFKQGDGDIPAVVQPLEVTENGTYTAPDGVDGYSPVTVNKEIVLQDKTITENGEYTADEGYDGLGKVLVEIASGGGKLVAKRFDITANADTTTLNHNMGVIPLIVVIQVTAYIAPSSLGSNRPLISGYGLSSELASIMGVTEQLQRSFVWNSTLSKLIYSPVSYSIDKATGNALFYNATETSIKIGVSGSYSLITGQKYQVNLIGLVTE